MRSSTWVAADPDEVPEGALLDGDGCGLGAAVWVGVGVGVGIALWWWRFVWCRARAEALADAAGEAAAPLPAAPPAGHGCAAPLPWPRLAHGLPAESCTAVSAELWCIRATP